MDLKINRATEAFFMIIIYALLLLNCGFFVHELGGALEFIRIALALPFLLIANRKFKIDAVAALFFLLTIVVISSLVNGDSMESVLVSWFDMIAAFCIAVGVSNRLEEMVRVYKKLMLVLCVSSLIIYLVSLLYNDALSIFPTFQSGGHNAYFCGLSFAYVDREYLDIRNLGIFWEPGAYQFFILLAIVAEMFIDKESKHKNVVLAIYTITMITTFSTTGIIALIAIWCVYLFYVKLNAKLALMLIGIVAFVCLMPKIIPESASLLEFSIVEKVSSLLNGSDEMFTAEVRRDSVVYPLKAFFDSPLIGVGRSGMKEWSDITGHSMNTCTPVNWLAHYGLFCFLVIFVGFCKTSARLFKKSILSLLVLLIIVFSTSTEAFNYEPTAIFISFFGYQYSKNKENLVIREQL